MPEVGEVERGYAIGRKSNNSFLWHACGECGKERWVELKSGTPRNKRCQSCAQMKNSHAWKSGRWKDKDGYIMVWLSPDDFFYPMAHKRGGNIGYVLEHRLVVAKHLGRCLQSWEKIHHKDGVKNHNEYSNLEISTAGSHILEHSKGYRDGYAKGLIDGKDKQSQELKRMIGELRQEIRLLRWEQKESERIINR